MKHAMTLATAIGLALALAGLPALAQNEFGSKELIEAAEKEGQLTYYTANFAETEQEVIKEFNKRFPKVKVAMVRAPGGQLITRIKTEAAAGKLGADVVNHSDRGLMLELADLFQDYTPPNAADYRPDALVSPKFWPGVTLGWAIAYNTQLVKNAPKSWKDLLNPEYKGKQIGQVVGPSGGTTWTREAIFAPEGVPIIPYADGIPKTAKSPNAAKLFMNWRLSKEGQAFQIAKLGNITSLKEPPSFPKGWDPKVIKVWVPNFKEFESLRESWLEQWNKTYGYRQ